MLFDHKTLQKKPPEEFYKKGILKDTPKEKAPSNKSPALTKM